MSGAWDGIVLGTGHNALVLQAYLCRAGHRVLSVDRADEPGGGLETIKNPRHPGFLHNTHGFFHRALTAMPWYSDLELNRHGARYIEPELNVAMICPDGRAIKWWTDPERTLASVAEFSRRDAGVLGSWIERFGPIVETILVPEAQSPPLMPERRQAWLESTSEGRLLLDVSRRSPLEFVREEFEHPAVRAGLLFFNGLREVDLRLPGFGHSIPALMAGRHKAQMCLGGAVELARALVSGAEVLVMDEPSSELDEQSEREILAHLCRLSKEEGKTVILAHHGLDHVAELTPVLCLVNHGRVSLARTGDLLASDRGRRKGARTLKEGAQ